MSTMVCLMGEQPIPVLLPVRHINPQKTLLVCTRDTKAVAGRLAGLVPSAETLVVPPYDVGRALTQMKQAAALEGELIVNLTGGTKLMALAAYSLAAERRCDFVYLDSQQRRSLLYRYRFDSPTPSQATVTELDTLINLDDYLRAHLPGYSAEGFSKEKNGQLTDGGRFEKAVHDALDRRGFEVLAGVRPQGVEEQIEIDLVVRVGNQVGIAEIKLGDAQNKANKEALDQLTTAGSREYLGTYTARFLITARPIHANGIRALAQAMGIAIIELGDYNGGLTLSLASAERLAESVRARLSPAKDRR